mmetsp:Transcript_4364/g.9663  ORF Transcript_4364/g.9663 Transcript_4364/m.9663 type:complete len:573 (-) Transcript_4364:63-1781(-)
MRSSNNFSSSSSPSPPRRTHHRRREEGGRGETSRSNSDKKTDNDDAVKSTADDAILAKLSCVERGYYHDPFLASMSHGASGLVNRNKPMSSSSTASAGGNRHPPPHHHPHRGCGHHPHRGYGPPSSTEPIIRRGTHARVRVIDRAISSFLSLPLLSKKNKNRKGISRQIVILGAGRDTTYLRYRFSNNDNNSSSREDSTTAAASASASAANNTAVNNTATNDLASLDDSVAWYEVDHPSMIHQKATEWLPNCMPEGYHYDYDLNKEGGNSYAIHITSKSTTNAGGAKEKSDSNNNTSPDYHLIGHDLRSPPSQLFDILTNPHHGYDTSLPTLFVLECVLMYLPYEASCDLLHYISNSPSSNNEDDDDAGNDEEDGAFVAVAIYDPIPSNDRFGKLMIDNLKRAGITADSTTATCRKRGVANELDNDENDAVSTDQHPPQQLSLQTTQTLSDQLSKLTITSKFTIATGCNMMDAYDTILTPADRYKAARCDMLDELEEFTLLMKHYCLVVGVSVSGSSEKGRSSKKENEDEKGENDKKRGGSNNNNIGLELCKVGKDSLMGFEEGRCTVSLRS